MKVTGAMNKKLLRHKLKTFLHISTAARNVSPSASFGRLASIWLEHSQGHRIRVFRVEVEIPDGKIFSDSTQDIY